MTFSCSSSADRSVKTKEAASARRQEQEINLYHISRYNSPSFVETRARRSDYCYIAAASVLETLMKAHWNPECRRNPYFPPPFQVAG
jgi:hypothetical protein